MRTDVIRPRSKLDARRVVLWLGAIVLGGWLAWCAIFQFLGVSTQAEVIRTYEVAGGVKADGILTATAT
jgi:hypothetical protein